MASPAVCRSPDVLERDFLYLVGTAYWLALWVDYNLLATWRRRRGRPSLTVAMATFWFPLSILHLGLAIVFFIQHEGPKARFSNHRRRAADRWAPPPPASHRAPPARHPSPRFPSHHRYFTVVDRGSTMTSSPQRPAAAALSTSI